MADSQSRYGIMDELNNKKIQAKEQLAKIENNLDNHKYKIENSIEDIKNNVSDKEKVYVRDFKTWKREQEVHLRLLEADFNRQKTAVENEIASKENSYESDFQAWKTSQLDKAEEYSNELNRFISQQEKAIKDQKEIIAEYEKSINDLKDMSKEKAE